MTSSRRFLHDDDGYATVFAAFVIAGIAATVVLVMFVGAAVVARHRAQSAADLAALAAAVEHVSGGRDPCGAAHRLTAAQEPPSEVIRCEIRGSDVLIDVQVPVMLGPFGSHRAHALSRAGPA